ncbi:MAG: hypothetical protein AB8G18_04110 [Gammaproteobacteria bacterium]
MGRLDPKALLRAIRIRSQFTTDSPYRAAGARDVVWKSTTTSLAPDALTLLLDGRYTFTPEAGVFPCRFQSNCCSKDGALYLDSCRVPTEEEMQAIKLCLSKDVNYRTDEYFECLDNEQVQTGCVDQEDGSRLCY